MKISAEKLAQIEAGAAPASVLTKAELAHYTKEMADLKEAADKEAAAQKVLDDAEADKLAKEAADKEAADKAAADGDKPVVVATGGFDIKALTDALKENGKLEAQAEDLTERLAKAETALAEAKAETASLIVVAQSAVKKLQVATGSPQVEKSGATEILAQFTDLQGKLAGIFKTDQQSSAAPVKEDAKPMAAGLRNKVAQLNAQKR